MHAFGEDPFQKMLSDFASIHPAPKAVLILSAHSLSSNEVYVLSTQNNTIQHDFGGFPDELYQIQYACPGSPEVAAQAHQLLRAADFVTHLDTQAPLDHGIWVPLKHLYPKGNVPVVRVSLPLDFSPAQILKMGHSLATLRDQGVMILGSGGAVHNLRKLAWNEKNSEGFAWANAFESRLIQSLKHKNVDDLLLLEEQPEFTQAHPSREHFLPILFAVGATLPGDEATILNKGVEYGSLSMLCFSLNYVQKKSLH